MEFSEKEKQLLDFITQKEKVTVQDIENELGKQAVGCLGKLIQREKIEKKKLKVGEGYGMKMVTHYFIKAEKKSENE